MKLFSIILILCLIFNCAENSNTNFVQTEDIQLEQPRVHASSTIIDSSIVVTSELRMANVAIYYTNDGSEPTTESKRYESDLKVSKAGHYKFKAFHPEYRPSAISEIKLYEKGILPSTFKWKTTANLSYPGLGDHTLINHKKATLSFRDTQWLGFDTIAKANITFKTPRLLKSLTMGYLVDTKSWIFPPESVSLIINQSDTLDVTLEKLNELKTLALKDMIIPIEKEVWSMRIEVQNLRVLPDWHSGKGLKAWLFMDEWIFNK